MLSYRMNQISKPQALVVFRSHPHKPKTPAVAKCDRGLGQCP
jgi:hypothetical protein